MNLIMNAVEAMGSSAGRARELRLRTEVDPDSVLITIADTGPGIDPKMADKSSSPFSRRNPAAWGWDFRFANLSSRRMKVGWQQHQASPAGQYFRYTYRMRARMPTNDELDPIEFVDKIRWSLSGGGRSKGVMPSGFIAA